MDEQDKQLLIADIKAAVIKELTGKDLRVAQDGPKPLKELYDKYREPLYKKYGVGTWAQVWECVRKLTVIRMGKRYVRDLLPSEEAEAAEIAESMLNQMLDSPD